jgi:hypothetical protein
MKGGVGSSYICSLFAGAYVVNIFLGYFVCICVQERDNISSIGNE